MPPPTSPGHPLTAADLMRRDLITIHAAVPLRTAVKLLARSEADVAAVVDDRGRCVGTLRVDDEVRRAAASAPGCPPTCDHQHRYPLSEVVTCTLPEDACPLQRESPGVCGPICLMPNAVLGDWQQVPDVGTGPTVQPFTRSAVLVPADWAVPMLVRLMNELPAEYVIVTEGDGKPAGIIGTNDIPSEEYPTHPGAGLACLSPP